MGRTMMGPALSSFVVAFFSLLFVVRADNFDDAILAYMDDQSILGAAVAFYDGSDSNSITQFARGYGKLSSSPSSGGVTANTAFMLASVGKVFAASTVAAMLHQGLIASLDEDICETTASAWANTNACRHPDFPNTAVTWRMLVTHRSSLIEDIPTVRVNGIDYDASYGPADYESYDGEPSYGNPTCPLNDAQAFYRALLTNNKSLTSVGGGSIDWYSEADGGWQQGIKPGSVFSYSNFAFGYLAALVELKTGKTFEEYSQERLFQPLGMERTSWFRESLSTGTVAAMPVYDDGENFQDVGHYCFIDFGSGQLYTTANDMATFLKAMLDRGVDDLWSNAIGDLLFACQERNAMGQIVQDCTTGIGWELINNSYKSSLSSDFQWLNSFKNYDWTGGALHDGSEYGITSQILVLPASQVYVAVMTNTDDSPAEGVANKVGEVANGGDGGEDDDSNNGNGCFSGRSTVQVKNKGATRMDALHIGDLVLTKDATYQKVYSFSHFDPSVETRYLEVRTTENDESVLQVTANHLIYTVDKKSKAVVIVPAGDIRVGDILVGKNDLHVKVEQIRVLTIRGAYAPLTVTGNIIVNGVAASNYVLLDQLTPHVPSPITQHWIQHASFAPYRIYCSVTGCEDETYDQSTGLSSYVTLLTPATKCLEHCSFAAPVFFYFAVMPTVWVLNNSMMLIVALWGFWYCSWKKTSARPCRPNEKNDNSS